MTDKVLIVGEAFGRPLDEPDPEAALSGGSAQRLWELAGLTRDEYLDRVIRINLVDAPEDYSDNDSLIRGIVRMAKLMERRKVERVVILGTRVAAVLGVTHWPLFQWRPWWTALLARSPHPSGRSRFWNDPHAVREAAEFWKETLDARPDPEPAPRPRAARRRAPVRDRREGDQAAQDGLSVPVRPPR